MKNRKLIIKSIGPIDNIEIELNRINVFIGEQGSGKSTISKIISYLSWVEKKILFERDYFDSPLHFISKLETFHKLKGYFNSKSYIYYETDCIVLILNNDDNFLSIKYKNADYKLTKISYIPAERNIMCSIPNWFEVKFDDNNIKSFLSDWEQARKKLTSNDELMILDGKIKYHYEEPNKDILEIDNKQMEMPYVASGYQSMIPLLVVTEYIAKGIFNENINISIKDESKFLSQLNLYVDKAIDDIIAKEPHLKLKLKGKLLSQKIYSNVIHKAISSGLISPFPERSHIIIEEPEQNLFPKTQRDIIYYLMNLVISSQDLSLTITTHSPYVLYALNNCIIGGKIGKNISSLIANKLPSKNSWIEPTDISVWQIEKDGNLKNIQNEGTNTIGKQFFNDIMNDIMGEYYLMVKHLK